MTLRDPTVAMWLPGASVPTTVLLLATAVLIVLALTRREALQQ